MSKLAEISDEERVASPLEDSLGFGGGSPTLENR
jgi:hypothetical protein